MSRSAVLIMDLQVDFLNQGDGRMPVATTDAQRVIETANAILDGKALQSSLPILILNQFPRSARIGNYFRHNAAILGTAGAELDSRIHRRADTIAMAKSAPSAFSNPELDRLLRNRNVSNVFIFGVFAEGCVRATALDARHRGYSVTVPIDAIGTNAGWKRKFAAWSMRRANVSIVPTLVEVELTTWVFHQAVSMGTTLPVSAHATAGIAFAHAQISHREAEFENGIPIRSN